MVQKISKKQLDKIRLKSQLKAAYAKENITTLPRSHYKRIEHQEHKPNRFKAVKSTPRPTYNDVKQEREKALQKRSTTRTRIQKTNKKGQPRLHNQVFSILEQLKREQ